MAAVEIKEEPLSYLEYESHPTYQENELVTKIEVDDSEFIRIVSYESVSKTGELDEKPFLGFQDSDLQFKSSNYLKFLANYNIYCDVLPVNVIRKKTFRLRSSSERKRRQQITLDPSTLGKHYFQCYYCSINIVCRDEMSLHIISEHVDKNDMEFYKRPHRSNLEMVEDAKLGAMVFACWQCNYNSTNKGCIKSHINGMHLKIMYKCPKCSHQTTDKGHLRTHIKAVHEKVTYQCPYCPHKATQTSNLSTHIKARHMGVTFPCEECNYQATYRESLQRHIDNIHKGIKHSCMLCFKQFNTNSGLRFHLVNVHKDDAILSCHYCSIIVGSRSNMKKHIRQEHAEYLLYSCQHCEEKFVNKRLLSSHFDLNHRVHECLKCSFVTNQESALTDHINKAHPQKKACFYCNFVTTDKDTLTLHFKEKHMQLMDGILGRNKS